jgi:hypothetical protein
MSVAGRNGHARIPLQLPVLTGVASAIGPAKSSRPRLSAGKKITAQDIRRARGALQPGRPKRRVDRPVQRMAA